jgi:peptidyl serine alpha-galactosyltransferase
MRSRRVRNSKGGEAKTGRTRTAVYLIFGLAILWVAFTLYYRSQVNNIVVSTNDKIPATARQSVNHTVLGQQQRYTKKQNDTVPDKDVIVIKKVKWEPKKDGEGFHVVFSTDCTPFQDWQTLLLFHSATVVKQEGPITRIASGCSDSKKADLTALYLKLYPQFHIHFTPDYKKDTKTQKSYDFYNKPYGMLHWMNNADPGIPEGTVIALVDPDFVFLRPLTAKITGDPSTIVSGGTKIDQLFERVERGRPVAQQYGLMAPWARENNRMLNRTRICGASSPCREVGGERAAAQHYSVGAPYILEKDDMFRVVTSWVEFVPRVYEHFPDLLAEMYAYSMGAAHNRLPHLQLDHYMVSNINVNEGEGWKWVDALGDDVCVAPNEKGIFYEGKPLPTFVHYCQFFRAAEWGFHKRRVFGDIFSCHRPMLLDPHTAYGGLAPADNRITKVDFKDRDGEIVKMTRTEVKRSSFVLCVIHTAINAALLDYKTRMCQNVSNTNYEKTINVALL